MTISLADLGIDEADDAGRTWHPRADKREARDDQGNLRDLSDIEVDEHAEKPEADEQPDGLRRRRRERRAALAAEDSIETAPEEI
jgi:hypothetical protein